MKKLVNNGLKVCALAFGYMSLNLFNGKALNKKDANTTNFQKSKETNKN